jgi:hypothetical protein
MLLARKLKVALSFLQKYGPIQLVNYSVFRCSELWNERHLGIETARQMDFDELGILSAEQSFYVPIPYRSLKRAMRRINVNRDEDVFVDYGAGLGRAVAIAATFPFRRVVGVELSVGASQIARQNLSKALGKVRCRNVEIVTANASEFELPSDATILHFFNPFSGETLQKTLINIRNSLELSPRNVTILFANPEGFDVSMKSIFPTEWMRGEETVKFYKTDLTLFFIYGFDASRYFYLIYRIDSRNPSHSAPCYAGSPKP